MHHELIATTVIAEPPSKMFFLCERFNVWRVIVLIHATFAAISLHVRDFVHRNGVFLIQWGAMKELDRLHCLIRRFIFDKSKSSIH